MKVYSGHIIPLMPREGERSYFSEFTLKDYVEYKDLLKTLRRELVGYVKNIENSEKEKFTLEKRLKAIGDFIVAFFTMPLNPPLYPRYGGEAYFPTPQEYYWLWVLSRYVSAFNDELWNKYGNLAELVKMLHERIMDLAKLTGVDKLVSGERIDTVFNTVIKIPADTRPGLNTSKLIIHLLTTSALAVCKGLCRGLNSLEIGVLRLACLLHDLGKPDQWFSKEPIKTSHAKLSADIAEELLKEVLNSETLNKIKELITFHHEYYKVKDPSLRKLCKILIESDSDASSVDRIADIVADTVAEELNVKVEDAKAMLKKSGVEVWKWWLSLSEDKIRKTTDTVAKKLSRKPLEIKEPTEADVVKDVRVVFCDLRGIQRFINVESLRALAIRSFIVDLATIYAIPRTLIEVFNVNPENVVYAGGGFAILIVPQLAEEYYGKLEERYREICGSVEGEIVAPEIVTASSPLYLNWGITFEKASEELYLRKHIVNYITPSNLIGFEELCEVCGKLPALRKGKCCICSRLDQAATELYFPSKIDVLRTYGYSVPKWDILEKWIIEWISGNRIDERKGGIVEEEGRVFSISIVKVDGNFIGAFIKDALNISDAFERSVRIDRALKKSLHKILTLLKTLPQSGKIVGVEKEILANMSSDGFTRLYTGVLYVGGDDALMLMPTWIALPASLYLAYWFWREIGGVRQISIGIASGKPKHNIWGLLEASTYMLDDVCKKGFRKELYETFKVSKNVDKIFNKLENIVAVVGFAYTEQQNLMKSIAEDIVSNPLVKQPYVLKYSKHVSTKLKDVRELLKIVLADKYVEKSTLEDELERILIEAYIAFHSARGNIEHVTVDARNVVQEIHSVASRYGDVKVNVQKYLAALSTYVARQKVRLEDKGDLKYKVYTKIAEYLAETFSNIIQKKIGFEEALPPLYDVYLVAKMIMGGAR